MDLMSKNRATGDEIQGVTSTSEMVIIGCKSFRHEVIGHIREGWQGHHIAVVIGCKSFLHGFSNQTVTSAHAQNFRPTGGL